MPPLIGAAAVIAGAMIVGLSATTAAILAGISIGAYLLSSALQPKPKRIGGIGSISGAGSISNISEPLGQGQQTITCRDPIATRKIVFGRVRVGGTVAFLGATEDSLYYHEVICFASHHCAWIGEVYFNDELAFDNSGNIQPAFVKNGVSLAHIGKHFGELDQAPDYDLIAQFPGKWTVNHKGNRVCYLYSRLRFGSEIYNSNPNKTAIIWGWDQIYDPRDGTYKYTDNAALCIAKYLNYALNAQYGTEIDSATLIASANICDELVNIPGGTEKRYTLNGVIDSATDPRTNIEKMLSAMAGRLIYSGGKWCILAGAYETPSAEASFNESDLRGNIEIRPRISKRDLFNAVKGIFISPKNKWQPSDFPPIASDVFMGQDNGERIWTDIELPYTITETMAQRLAKIYLYSTREQISLSAPFSLKALKVKPGDTIKLSISRMGWTEKVFLVTGWEFTASENEENPELLINMEVRETSSAIYQIGADEYTLIASAPDTNLPNPWEYCSEVFNVEIAEELFGTKNNLLTKLKISYHLPNRFHHGEVWISKDNISYSIHNANVQNYFEIDRVDESQTYFVKISPVNRLNIKRPLNQCTAYSHYVFGKTAKPEDVSEFWAEFSLGGLHFRWTEVSDLDCDYYEIKFSSDPDATVDGAIEIARVSAPASSKTIPAAKSGKYFIRAVDTSGNKSANAKSIITDIPTILNWNVQETLLESPLFIGTKTDMFLEDGILYLGSAGLFDSDDMFDSDLNFDFGEFGAVSVGYYESSEVNLGSIQSSRCSLDLEFIVKNWVVNFDGDEMFDSDQLFDEDTSMVGVIPQIALSQNGVDWGGWQNFFIGDYIAKSIKFRIKAFSNYLNQYLGVNVLQFSVDMPDRIETDQDVVIPAIGQTINFSKPYMTKPKIGITIQSGNDGDRYVLGVVTVDDFAIQIKNGASGIEKTIDWEARGY